MLNREQKTQQIEELGKSLSLAKTVVLASYRGLKLAELEDLRRGLKKKNISFRVVKNSLLKRAFAQFNYQIPEEVLSKPLAVAFGTQNELDAPKIIVEFSKEHSAFQIVGGVYEDNYQDGADIKAVALLPGKEELYIRVVGSISRPLSRFIGALRWNGQAVVSILNQRLNQINNQ